MWDCCEETGAKLLCVAVNQKLPQEDQLLQLNSPEVSLFKTANNVIQFTDQSHGASGDAEWVVNTS